MEQKYIESLDNRISKIEERLEPVFEYIKKKKALAEEGKRKKDYWNMVTSGSIAAIVSSAAALLFSR
mgnify:FL=1